MDGDGVSTNAGYTTAFPNAEDNMGCNETAVTITSTGNPACTGYELAANLDFDTDDDGDVDSGDTYWNSGAGWTPIGDATTGYTGEFEGNGASYKISNLFINSTTSSGSAYAGLFGVIGSGGEVRNVKLEDVDVTAAVTSTTASHEVYAGAVVGKNSGTVSGSSSLGEVAITRSGGTSAGKGYAGGLVGWNDGTIVSSYSRAEVTATSDDANEAHAGGLVALNDTGDTIAASFATGSVTATTADTGTLTNTAHAGGLVSHNKGTITASYAHGDGTVKGNKVARGGFAATNASGATITASFSTGSHTGTGTGTGATTASGGFTATQSGTVNYSYWDATTSGHRRRHGLERAGGQDHQRIEDADYGDGHLRQLGRERWRHKRQRRPLGLRNLHPIPRPGLRVDGGGTSGRRLPWRSRRPASAKARRERTRTPAARRRSRPPR